MKNEACRIDNIHIKRLEISPKLNFINGYLKRAILIYFRYFHISDEEIRHIKIELIERFSQEVVRFKNLNFVFNIFVRSFHVHLPQELILSGRLILYQ